ncbi:MBL fold metallo-hydrolase [Desulfurivibrio sp. D14AmB]|uniref:MBL fold metallo-hydrolase n=1 Tax=Desulfurivibrio sp. D14AmB TaxID=3374370 RepID=UPI00376EF61F
MSTNKPYLFSAAELFDRISQGPDFVLLDVRNEKDFANWSVEGPRFFPYINIPYFHFMENVRDSLAQIPAGEKILIVCAKEGSAKYVADILVDNGFADVGYLEQGIVGWGNLLVSRRVNPASDPYHLYQLNRPGKASCSYLLVSGREAMVFDPSRNIEAYIELAASHGATIIRTFETHRQADYISGGPALVEKTGCLNGANRTDFEGADFSYGAVENNDTFGFAEGGPEVKALHTPGHTMGSTCYLIAGQYLLSGDTIFINTSGRPDLGGKWEQWARELYLSLMLRLRHLDDEIVVLPGHYTTWEEADQELLIRGRLGDLRRQVAAFRQPNEKKFAEFIQENMRPQPGVYAEIRRVNGGWLKVSPEEANIMDLGKNECGASNYGKVGVSAEVLRQ